MGQGHSESTHGSELSTVLASGLAQGIALVSFPAASHILLSATGFGFTSTQYGFLFAPQVLTAIAASLLGGALSRRWGVKKIYRVGLLADLVAMALLAGSQLVAGDRGAAYLVLLNATAFLGAGFGLTVPALNALVAGLRPHGADRAVLLLNALLGLGTALAPAFTAIFLGLGFWWGLPLLVIVMLLALLLASRTLPLEGGQADSTSRTRASIPPRFYLFAAVALLYGLSETISGNWSAAAMTSRFAAGTTVAALSLTAFWASVTVGRLLFAGLEKVIAPRLVFRGIPVLIIAAYLIIALAHRPGPVLGIVLFALAGLGCSALLPSIISFGQQDLPAMQGSAAGGLIAAYQIGYGLAAFTVSPLMAVGLGFGLIFGIVAVATAVMTVLIYQITGNHPQAWSRRAART
jgi:MFS family permease